MSRRSGKKVLWALLAGLLLSLLLLGFRGASAQLATVNAPPASATAPSLSSASPSAEAAPEATALPSASALLSASALSSAEAAPAIAASPAENTAEEALFLADLTTLTRAPHRLAGTEAGRAAAAHIEQRLRASGLNEIYPLEMPVWQQATPQCDLEVNGQRLRAHALRPNVVVPPVTPQEGITAPLLFAGRGELRDYKERNAQGAIVVLDYDSHDHWELAFALGARAVVFLGQGDETPILPKHAGVPSNQVRVYVDQRASTLDLRSDYANATLRCEVVWQRLRGRNILARVRGTAPQPSKDAAPEVLILSANYDSFGVVPELSPGARGAANVAALLEAAARFQKNPPKRDVLFAFLDNESRGHQGARELYAALLLSQEESARWLSDQERELAHVRAMLDVLARQGLTFIGGGVSVAGVAVEAWLENELRKQADYARDDVRNELRVVRLSAGRSPSTEVQHRIRELDALSLRWDEVRRALHDGQLREFVQSRAAGSPEGALFQSIFNELLLRTQSHFERRIGELQAGVTMAQQQAQLRAGLGFDQALQPHISLHVTFNFADAGAKWGVVVGDWTSQLFAFRPPKTEGDTPGYYGRILNAVRDVASGETLLDHATLSDPSLGPTFAPGPFVASGAIAGAYGIYNVSLMTGYDRRARDGQPADVLEPLDWKKLRSFALEGSELLRRLANTDGLSLPRVFKNQAVNKLPGWNNGQSTGDYAGLTVSGSLAEDRAAAGGLMALWPGQKTWLRQAWLSLRDADQTPFFDPLSYEAVDENGRFRVLSFREDMHVEVMTLGAVFDPRGVVRAISTTEHQAQKLSDAMRVNLFFGKAGSWTSLSANEGQPGLLKLLKASSDSFFRDNRALWGQLGRNGFFYISDQFVDYRLKLFEPMGGAVLGDFAAKFPYGAGVDPLFFSGGTALAEQNSRDLWALNESRLRKLRTRGVTSADLEILHGRATRAAEQAQEQTNVETRQAALLRSAALSQRVYLPLRQKMDDLVHAIVMLLLLSIPFAFALERLLFCAATIYGRIGGFTLTFLVTFGLLYWMHPGFAIASTPMIIFLAFAIVLLSSLVIYIVVRKFKTELRAAQGQSGGHTLEVSRAGTLLAAVGMGMSTMRRRPTRTFLTAITVVMLTFTILSFASFSQTLGVRAIYEGPVNEQTAPRLLLRKLDYSALPSGVLDLLKGREGEGGLLAPHYWLVRQQASAPRLTVARQDSGQVLAVDAVMGIVPAELSRWSHLAEALGKGSSLEKEQLLSRGGVFLPPILQEVLKVKPGDRVLLNGQSVEFAGVLDGPALQRLKHLDNQSLLPVDFQDAASLTAANTSNNKTASENDLLLAEESDREFVHLSSDQVVVASAELVRSLGGKLHSIGVHPGPGVNAVERGQRLAELLVMPVWAAGEQGVERMLLTVLTGVSGGFALFVPLLLGGLIIFGTLLGSITDREKEIYTFSALGLSPGHVGVLFFAEAAVYAVVGGMGGQLLAQTVGLVASRLAEAGIIQPTSINYSSTNSLFAIAVVMGTVLVSAIYPALRASRSANPGLARRWQMPPADGDKLELTFPFTVSNYDITGVVSFLAEHFRRHDDAGLGNFAASQVALGVSASGNLELQSELALAPFDLGVTQHLVLTAVPSEIPGVDEVAIAVRRLSGARGDWYRANKTFLRDLRRQFLLWRTLSSGVIEGYRKQTLELLGSGVSDAPAAPSVAPGTEPGGGPSTIPDDAPRSVEPRSVEPRSAELRSVSDDAPRTVPSDELPALSSEAPATLSSGEAPPTVPAEAPPTVRGDDAVPTARSDQDAPATLKDEELP